MTPIDTQHPPKAMRKTWLICTWILTAVLTACGGGGGGGSSTASAINSTTTAPATAGAGSNLPTQTTGTASIAVNQSVVVLDGTQTSSLQFTSPLGRVSSVSTVNSAQQTIGTTIQPGQAVLVPPGQDSRLPFGVAAFAVSTPNVTQSSNQIALRPATFAEVYQESSSTQTAISLGASNFLGVIAPSAVRGTSTSVSTKQSNSQGGSVSALHGALTIYPAKITEINRGNEKLPAVLAANQEPNPSEIALKTKIRLKDFYKESDAITRLKPYGKSGEANLEINIILNSLTLTKDHEFKKILGVPYDLKSLDLKLKGASDW